MRILVIILIISSIIQSSVLPLELSLIILLCRSYIKISKGNLYLAFSFGLLISHLTLTPIGIKSILYLTLVQIMQILSKTRFAGNPLTLVPLTFMLLLINQVVSVFLLSQTVQFFPKVLIESFLSLPVFYLLRFWEERFIVEREIKLKI